MKKVLVANRGEIALRVMRTCQKMGIHTVAIYSEADATAPFVQFADESVCVGPPPSAQSYLQGDKIITIAQELGVDGIHPGYGFLSENSDFARKLKKTGIQLIGPSPESMEVMGDKLKAKEAVKSYNIPLVPGTEGAITDPEEARVVAEEIGYPVLIKASAGGGGKGMRIVHEAGELKEAIEMAQNEARSSFGDDAVFVEKFVEGPRHIEIQILADRTGNTVYLFERECSIQRRHQKVIEEAPSAVLTPEKRKAMGECAVLVAKACNYEGAGTVEFLYDAHDDFYFLEMNTRLQVEHPVTEEITSLDLVEEQINIARGRSLAFEQDDLKIHGHAIEVRVYAEDTAENFIPDIGRLEIYQRPSGDGVRVDDGLEEGMDIPIYYDPMIAKLVVHGKDREEAIAKTVQAIDDYQIRGVKTTLGFCRFAIQHPAFASGKFDTHFVGQYYQKEYVEGLLEEAKEAAAFLAAQQSKATPKADTYREAEAAQGMNWKQNR